MIISIFSDNIVLILSLLFSDHFHLSGCGGFVVNEHGQVLVIKEKYHEKPKWKFPGGHADPGAAINQ